MYYILLFICIFTRLATSIYYIEDIDSLRFAYSVADEYSIKNLQPHFPGYPIFSFLGKSLYVLIGNLGASFSLIGGVALFIIIFFSLKFIKVKLNSMYGLLISLFILLNPMLWLMSNRYMPDLLGLSIVLSAFYLLMEKNSSSFRIIGALLGGLLIGVRLSYFPILVGPIFFLLKKNKLDLKIFYSFLIGIIIWLIPLIYIEGLFSLYTSAYNHTIGHFFDFGGSIITESNIFLRIKYLVITIWADGFGLFYPGRFWFTLVPILPICFLLFDIKNQYKEIIKNKKIKWLLISMIFYLIWILLFQNLIYKSRHVLPLVLSIIIFIFSVRESKIIKLMSFLYIISISFITFNLVQDHRNGTAISHLSKNLNIKNADIIFSNPLINYYLKSQGNNSKFLNIDEYKTDHSKEINPITNILVIGHYTDLFINNFTHRLDTIYYHNPYMNRMWSEIPVYTLTKKD